MCQRPAAENGTGPFRVLFEIEGRAKQISQDRIMVTEGSGDMQGKVPLLRDPTRFALVNLAKVGDSTLAKLM